MSEGQKLLMKYLVSINSPMDCTLLIVDMMWEERTIRKLFKYILENQDSDYLQLYEIAYKIASEEGTLNYYPKEDD